MQLQLFDSFPAQPADRIIQKVVRPGNLLKAYQRVKRNGGAPGVDGQTVEQLGQNLAAALKRITEELVEGNYQPSPVRQVEIPKANGGVRKLGIPTVTDRVVQQALLQVLTPVFDPGFSKWSFGFRPQTGTHAAIRQARKHIHDGYWWTVDVDLEKFFDTVSHDVLMSLLARRIQDKSALKLIRRFLQSGAMIGGLSSPSLEGTPQGGPLSPLLSNVMLDVLDKELEKRGHRFCRYADDCNIYVRTRRAGERLMKTLTSFLSRKLRLTVNRQKSAVAKASQRQFLGYSVTAHKQARLKVAPEREKRLRVKLRQFLRPARGRNLKETLIVVGPKLTGWAAYYQLCEVKSTFERLDEWIRRRIRVIIWRQWKRPRTRFKEMVKRGLERDRARKSASNGRGPWWNAGASHMNQTFTTKRLREMGYVSLLEEWQRLKRSAA